MSTDVIRTIDSPTFASFLQMLSPYLLLFIVFSLILPLPHIEPYIPNIDPSILI